MVGTPPHSSAPGPGQVTGAVRHGSSSSFLLSLFLLSFSERKGSVGPSGNPQVCLFPAEPFPFFPLLPFFPMKEFIRLGNAIRINPPPSAYFPSPSSFSFLLPPYSRVLDKQASNGTGIRNGCVILNSPFFSFSFFPPFLFLFLFSGIKEGKK